MDRLREEIKETTAKHNALVVGVQHINDQNNLSLLCREALKGA